MYASALNRTHEICCNQSATFWQCFKLHKSSRQRERGRLTCICKQYFGVIESSQKHYAFKDAAVFVLFISSEGRSRQKFPNRTPFVFGSISCSWIAEVARIDGTLINCANLFLLRFAAIPGGFRTKAAAFGKGFCCRDDSHGQYLIYLF